MRRKKSLLIPAVLAFSFAPVLLFQYWRRRPRRQLMQLIMNKRHIPQVLRILLIPLMKKAPSQTLIFRVNG